MEHQRADNISPLDMFKIGIGPSSSHTMGPMVAALEFRNQCIKLTTADIELRFEVELYGSLSATGRGHATDGAICAGLMGMHPKENTPEEIWQAKVDLENNPKIDLAGQSISFDPEKDLHWLKWKIDDHSLKHPNTMRFRLLDDRSTLIEEVIYSVGGGFVEKETSFENSQNNPQQKKTQLPYPFNTASELVQLLNENKITPWQLVIENEKAKGLSEADLRKNLSEILTTMDGCIQRGLNQEGILPGGLNVRRRAKSLHQKITSGSTKGLESADLIPSVYAIAVNEENAAGGRVVTAPTNGASGLIPGVFFTLKDRYELDEETLQNGLMVASTIGALVKVHASISGAEVGCQGEVGTSCAMAAAGACAMLGGTANQIEQAAEIGIEHHLGMTCDPIMGLVQVPCIERNAMGAVKALNATALSLASDGTHLVSLDKALSVMKQTGLDMNKKYKETSTGGLALG